MIFLASEIRINVNKRLSRNVYDKLLELFVDRTSIDTSFRRFMGKNENTPRYSHCLCLNNEKTIKFNQSFKQDSDIFDEKRQIWVSDSVDLVEDDLFIPRDDVND